jgi:maltose O-acetyltransferase
MTEKDKMLAGELYNSFDEALVHERLQAKELCHAFNNSPLGDNELPSVILKQLFGRAGKNLVIEPPFHCDYGSNIFLGDNVYFNFNCIILDPAKVEIGDNVLVGPAVQIYTATHPISVTERKTMLESAKPIRIASDVWIGGGAIICPGVQIGRGSVIGAGGVVTRNVPAGVVAAGNPCRVIRKIER